LNLQQGLDVSLDLKNWSINGLALQFTHCNINPDADMRMNTFLPEIAVTGILFAHFSRIMKLCPLS
jgi:hypothetical protein